MILKIFLPKNLAKNLAIFAQNKGKNCKTLVFEKNANFLTKIVIITSTPATLYVYVFWRDLA
jgi:hypothetical protein